MIKFLNKLIWRRVKNLWSTFSRVFSQRKSGVFVDAKTAEKRLDACKSCDEYGQKSGMCSICGCVMSAKVKFRAAKCSYEDQGKKSRWPS
jgi:hypothetical protein